MNRQRDYKALMYVAAGGIAERLLHSHRRGHRRYALAGAAILIMLAFLLAHVIAWLLLIGGSAYLAHMLWASRASARQTRGPVILDSHYGEPPCYPSPPHDDESEWDAKGSTATPEHKTSNPTRDDLLNDPMSGASPLYNRYESE